MEFVIYDRGDFGDVNDPQMDKTLPVLPSSRRHLYAQFLSPDSIASVVSISSVRRQFTWSIVA